MRSTEKSRAIESGELWCTKHDCALVQKPWEKPHGMRGSLALVCLACVAESRKRFELARPGSGRA
jgi:hypothetical protein